MEKKVYLEDEMEKELVKRGHNIYDSDNCVDSSELCWIAVEFYGFHSRFNSDEVLEFTGRF